MRVLELLRGRWEPEATAEADGSPDTGTGIDTYSLPVDDYEAAFSVAVSRTELTALKELIDAEASTPYVDGIDRGSEPGQDDTLDAQDENRTDDRMDSGAVGSSEPTDSGATDSSELADSGAADSSEPDEAVEPIPDERGDVASLESVVEAAWADDAVDATAWLDRLERPRRDAETLLETWLEQAPNDIGVIYVTPDTARTVPAFVHHCTRRARDDDDPFEFPESMAGVGRLVERLDGASGRDRNRVFVRTEHVPKPD